MSNRVVGWSGPPVFRRPFGRATWRTAILATLALFSLGACADEENPALDFLVRTEGTTYDRGEVPENRVEELRGDIEELRDEVEQTTQRYGRIASFQKLLARELMQQEMYGPALDALEEAIEIQTDNAVLYYLAGLAAARSARAGVVSGEEQQYLERAERLYEIAVQIRPDYTDALFGLAVLLAFELDRPEEALPHARKLANMETADPQVRFLLANVLVRAGRADEAAEVYGRLARTAPSQEQRRRAAENRDALRTGG